jgi:hypothetical protein
MVTESEALPLNPSPIWIVVGGTERYSEPLHLIAGCEIIPMRITPEDDDATDFVTIIEGR